MKTAFQHTDSQPSHITIRTLAIVGSLWFMAILAPTAAGQTQPNFELPRTPDETPAMVSPVESSTEIPLVTPMLRGLVPDLKEARLNHLRHSGVWTEIDASTLDLKDGPQGPGSFTFNQEVTCKYHTPGRVMGGASPKFLCEVNGEIIKVKYLPDRSDPSSNREIYAEIAATRLFWALGFAADRSYPVLLKCEGCPASPMDGPSPEEQKNGRYKHAITSLGIALIERRVDGKTIETKPDQGWKWKELDKYVGTYMPNETRSNSRDSELASIRMQVEALKLLQIFVQHGDCKPKQQRLVCLPKGVASEQSEARMGTTDDPDWRSCTQSYVIADDVGSTFGGAGNLTKSSAKMSLKHWAKKDVIDLAHYKQTHGQCKGVLNTSMSCSGGVENPIITESGRKFLLSRLQLLSDHQIRDLFIAAQVNTLDEDEEEGGVEAWVAVFKNKVRQIATHPCRDS